MMLRKLLAWALVAVTPVVATAQLGFDETVVSVNGDAVDAGTYYRRMAVLPDVGRMQGNQFAEARPGFLVLQQLLNEYLIIDLATEENVAPTDEDVEAELQRRLEQNPRFVELFLGIGLTEDDLRHDIRVQLSEFNVLTKGINITDLEVENHYQTYPEIFTVPERFLVRVIGVEGSSDRQAVDEALASGTAFEEVARQLSQDVTASSGGMMGELPADSLAPAVRSAMQATAAGDTTDWLSGETMSFKFLVEEKFEEQLQPLDDGLRRSIRNQMMLDRGRATKDYAGMLQQMREEAEIAFTGTPFDRQLAQVFGQE